MAQMPRRRLCSRHDAGHRRRTAVERKTCQPGWSDARSTIAAQDRTRARRRSAKPLVADVRAISRWSSSPGPDRRRNITFAIRGPGEESNLACGRGEPSLGPPHPVRVVAVCLPAHDARIRSRGWPATKRCTHSCGRDGVAAVPNSPTPRPRSRLPRPTSVSRPEWTMPISVVASRPAVPALGPRW